MRCVCTGSSILNRCYRPDIRCAISLQWGRLSIERRRALAATLPPSPRLFRYFLHSGISSFSPFDSQYDSRYASHSLFSPNIATEFTGNIKMLEKSKDHDRSIGDAGVELIPITEMAVLAECTPMHRRAHRGSRASSYDRNVGAGRGLDKFPFLRKYL